MITTVFFEVHCVRPWPSVEPAIVQDLQQDVERRPGAPSRSRRAAGRCTGCCRTASVSWPRTPRSRRNRAGRRPVSCETVCRLHGTPLMSMRTIRPTAGRPAPPPGARRQLGLADAGRPRNRKLPIETLRVGSKLGAGAAHCLRDGPDRLVLPDYALVQVLLKLEAAAPRSSWSPGWVTGMPVARETTSAMSAGRRPDVEPVLLSPLPPGVRRVAAGRSSLGRSGRAAPRPGRSPRTAHGLRSASPVAAAAER